MPKPIQELPVFNQGIRLPLLPNATVLGTDATGNVIARKSGVVIAPAMSVTAQPIGTTATLIGSSVSIPATVISCYITVTAMLTSVTVNQNITPMLKFGTTGTASDATIAGIALNMGSLSASGERIIADFAMLSATSAIASVTTFNVNLGTAFTGTPSQTAMSGGGTPGPVSIVPAQNYLGLYVASSTANAVIARMVVYNVI